MAFPSGLAEATRDDTAVRSPGSPFGEREGVAGVKNDGSCSPVTQFRRSLLALKCLGLQGSDGVGIHGVGDMATHTHTPMSPVVRDIIESTEEQEAAQMRILLEERSRAREMVQRLERDKQMQAEQLRMMEERMDQSEMTEEELRETEAALRRASREVETLAASKDALERELNSQLEREEEWSRRLRDAERAGMSSTEKAIKERDEYAAKVEALERELQANRAREVNELIENAKEEGRGTNKPLARTRKAKTTDDIVAEDTAEPFATPEPIPVAKAFVTSHETETPRARVKSSSGVWFLAAFIVAVLAVAAAVFVPKFSSFNLGGLMKSPGSMTTSVTVDIPPGFAAAPPPAAVPASPETPPWEWASDRAAAT